MGRHYGQEVSMWLKPRNLLVRMSLRRPFGRGQEFGLLVGHLGIRYFPHARCPHHAASLGKHNCMLAWQRVVPGIRKNVGDAK